MVKICVFDTETMCLPPLLPGKDCNERNVVNYNNLFYG